MPPSVGAGDSTPLGTPPPAEFSMPSTEWRTRLPPPPLRGAQPAARMSPEEPRRAGDRTMPPGAYDLIGAPPTLQLSVPGSRMPPQGLSRHTGVLRTTRAAPSPHGGSMHHARVMQTTREYCPPRGGPPRTMVSRTPVQQAAPDPHGGARSPELGAGTTHLALLPPGSQQGSLEREAEGRLPGSWRTVRPQCLGQERVPSHTAVPVSDSRTEAASDGLPVPKGKYALFPQGPRCAQRTRPCDVAISVYMTLEEPGYSL